MWHTGLTACPLTSRALTLIPPHTHTHKNTPLVQGKLQGISQVRFIIKRGDPLRQLCAMFGHACVHLVWVGGCALH